MQNDTVKLIFFNFNICIGFNQMKGYSTISEHLGVSRTVEKKMT